MASGVTYDVRSSVFFPGLHSKGVPKRSVIFQRVRPKMLPWRQGLQPLYCGTPGGSQIRPPKSVDLCPGGSASRPCKVTRQPDSPGQMCGEGKTASSFNSTICGQGRTQNRPHLGNSHISSLEKLTGLGPEGGPNLLISFRPKI